MSRKCVCCSIIIGDRILRQMPFVIAGDLHERRDGEHRGVPGHREEQVDAHGHQLLPLQPRLLRSHDARLG